VLLQANAWAVSPSAIPSLPKTFSLSYLVAGVASGPAKLVIYADGNHFRYHWSSKSGDYDAIYDGSYTTIRTGAGVSIEDGLPIALFPAIVLPGVDSWPLDLKPSSAWSHETGSRWTVFCRAPLSTSVSAAGGMEDAPATLTVEQPSKGMSRPASLTFYSPTGASLQKWTYQAPELRLGCPLPTKITCVSLEQPPVTFQLQNCTDNISRAADVFNELTLYTDGTMVRDDRSDFGTVIRFRAHRGGLGAQLDAARAQLVSHSVQTPAPQTTWVSGAFVDSALVVWGARALWKRRRTA
jgi:hypothetical protein